MSTTSRDSQGEEGATDADLVALAATGHDDAFAELYRRYADRARWVARGVTPNAEDVADAVAEAFARVFRVMREGRFPEEAAFWPYLVTTTRRAAIDQARRAAPTAGGDSLDRRDLPALTTRPSERVVAVENTELVRRAFLSLPQHLQSVLYLTEVKATPMHEVAALLGIKPNAAAQRAVRARARLRQRYLQAHLAPSTDPRCRDTVERLGAYVGGGLSTRDMRKVDQHLEGCKACRKRKAELDDLGSALRIAVLPLPLEVPDLGAAGS